MAEESLQPQVANVTDITAIRTRQRVLELFEAEQRQSRWYGGLVVQARRAIEQSDYRELDRLLALLRATGDVQDNE